MRNRLCTAALLAGVCFAPIAARADYALISVTYWMSSASAAVTAGATKPTVVTGFTSLSTCQDAANQFNLLVHAAGNTDGNMKTQTYCFQID